jgi:hypothetical protein
VATTGSGNRFSGGSMGSANTMLAAVPVVVPLDRASLPSSTLNPTPSATVPRRIKPSCQARRRFKIACSEPYHASSEPYTHDIFLFPAT